jgi:hypothetical protein
MANPDLDEVTLKAAIAKAREAAALRMLSNLELSLHTMTRVAIAL